MSANKFGEAWEEQETTVKWRDDMVFKLIALRKKYNNVFSGKRGSARDGWTVIASELGLIDYNYKVLQKKWQNLVQKYKEVNNPAHHPTNTDGPLTTTWVFYNAMDQLLRDPEIANQSYIDSPKTVRQVQSSDGDSRHMIEYELSDISLAQDSSEQPFKRKKMSPGYESHDQAVNPVAVQYVDSSEPPQWFHDFLATYRQDEAKRMEALKSMHGDVMRLERKKCALLQELISKLSADDETLSESPPPSNSSKSNPLDESTATLTVTVDQNKHFKVDTASMDCNERADDNELRATDDLDDGQIIIRPDTGVSLTESLVTLNQSSLGGKPQMLLGGKAATSKSVSSKSVISPGQSTSVKFVVANQANPVKGIQPLLIKTTTSRGKLVVPMRKLVVPVNETSSLGSASVIADSTIALSDYQCINASDTV